MEEKLILSTSVHLTCAVNFSQMIFGKNVTDGANTFIHECLPRDAGYLKVKDTLCSIYPCIYWYLTLVSIAVAVLSPNVRALDPLEIHVNTCCGTVNVTHVYFNFPCFTSWPP